jgi:lipoprotein-anchoring transpeptidase ErfK/SrfK
MRRFRIRSTIRLFSKDDLWIVALLCVMLSVGCIPWLRSSFISIFDISALALPKVSSGKPVPRLTTGISNTQSSGDSAASANDAWIEVSIKERKLRLRDRDNQILMEVPVAVGKPTTPTPVGQFEVIEMTENPVWQNPFNTRMVIGEKDPHNPLGLRWIGFKQAGANDYGMHGTYNLSSIGRPVTNGCIRLRNEDIMALFDQVEEGTQVIVHP